MATRRTLDCSRGVMIEIEEKNNTFLHHHLVATPGPLRAASADTNACDARRVRLALKPATQAESASAVHDYAQVHINFVARSSGAAS